MGALNNLGHTVGRTTIAEILAQHGIVPAPERGERTRWRDFLSRHKNSMRFDCHSFTPHATVVIKNCSAVMIPFMTAVYSARTSGQPERPLDAKPTRPYASWIAHEFLDTTSFHSRRPT